VRLFNPDLGLVLYAVGGMGGLSAADGLCPRAARWRAARVGILGGVEGDPEAAEAGEAFDHELTDVLQARGHELEELSQQLLATGAGSIAGPGVILRARLRAPRWWRRGSLEISTEDSVSGEVRRGSWSLGRAAGRDRESLIMEITVDLALMLLGR
jgi:hypothetical protein